MPTYVVLLGPPGAGKGTQAKIVSRELDLPHISSGDLFRENLKLNTSLGVMAKVYIDRGELVPDDVTIAMIRERLSRADCSSGALLDGFPRTTAQARALDEMLVEYDGRINAVPYINVPEEELIERLTGRWTCKAQGHVFHERHNPPKISGKCDVDGSDLYQRDDDKVETVRHRIAVYLEQTQPLIEYYRKKTVLIEVDGSQPIEKVASDLIAEITRTVSS